MCDGNPDCGHGEDELNCQSLGMSVNGGWTLTGMRLEGPESLLQFAFDNGSFSSWGSMCAADWNDAAAQVACKMFGFPYGRAVNSTSFDAPAANRCAPNSTEQLFWLQEHSNEALPKIQRQDWRKSESMFKKETLVCHVDRSDSDLSRFDASQRSQKQNDIPSSESSDLSPWQGISGDILFGCFQCRPLTPCCSLIWLSSVNCTGSESNLFSCTYDNVGLRGCGAGSLAALNCSNELFTGEWGAGAAGQIQARGEPSKITATRGSWASSWIRPVDLTLSLLCGAQAVQTALHFLSACSSELSLAQHES